MNQKWLKYSIAGVMLTAASSAAFASGSDAVGAAQTGDRAAYNLGKRVLATKVVCKACPMAGKKINRDAAESILNDGTGAQLNKSEKKALRIYLKRRFKL